MKKNRFDLLRQEAVEQVAAGADILDVNVKAPDLDETYLLPKAVEIIISELDASLCMDIDRFHISSIKLGQLGTGQLGTG